MQRAEVGPVEDGETEASELALEPRYLRATSKVEDHGCPLVLEVGDLVVLPGASTNLGLIRQMSDERGHGACLVSPLLSHTSVCAKDVEVLAASLHLKSRADFADVVDNFEDQSAFGDLVFLPSGLSLLAACLRRRRCKICTLGGSISMQKAGYRSSLVTSLERRGVAVEDVPAVVGVAGSKPLSLVVEDLVVSKKPDLLIIEVAVNDGDELLECTPLPDVAGILRATEGIVRTVKRKSPDTAIMFLEMFLRDDTEQMRILKTGSHAWRDTASKEAIMWYHRVAPALHHHVCRHYGLTQINLIPAMRSLCSNVREAWFRDDCHHTEHGGEELGRLLARILLWSVRQPVEQLASALPRALDSHSWFAGRTLRIGPKWAVPPFVFRKERDPMNLGGMLDWILLRVGGKVTIPFKGRACGLVTLLGPDAPRVSVSVDGRAPTSLCLFDRWCYYWRDAVVLLCEGLDDTTHLLDIEVQSDVPWNILKRPPVMDLWKEMHREACQEGRPVQQLWLSYACSVEGEPT